MKIGITCYPTFGGSGTIATDLGKHLSRRGHEIHFIASSLPYRLRFHSSPNLYFHEVEKVNYPLFESSPYILLLASKMAEIARTYSLDILHVHYAIPHAVSAHLAKQILGRHSPKIITTLHGTDVTLIGNLRSLKPLTRFSITKSNGITTVSNFLKKRTEEIFNIRNDIRVIPNFIDPDDFNRKIKKCTCIPRKSPGEKTIIHISNFRKVKRIPDVISVFKGIADCLPARLLLVGEGPETLVAQEKIREYGLEQRVLFLGLVDNVSPVISHTDLLLQISDHESFGLSSLEALACGVPVIGTCGSGLSEVVVDGKNGCLSPPGNTDKMILDACTLLTNREKYQAFSKHAEQWALKKFSASHIVRQYERYYKEAINQ